MSERMPTGIGTMEARTDAMLDLSREQNRLAEAIEARATSPEVSLLNDSAALEIFGSGDRTYTNPETGAVVASPEKPILGKLDDIRKNPKYGKTQADRDASAEEYQSDLENLLDDGLELCQAKMIMDMRESDVEARATRTAKLIAGGSTAAEADAKAREEYEKKDATRVRLIKEGGAFTAEDYEQVRKGNELYPATPVEGAAERTESKIAAPAKPAEAGEGKLPTLREARDRHLKAEARLRELTARNGSKPSGPELTAVTDEAREALIELGKASGWDKGKLEHENRRIRAITGIQLIDPKAEAAKDSGTTEPTDEESKKAEPKDATEAIKPVTPAKAETDPDARLDQLKEQLKAGVKRVRAEKGNLAEFSGSDEAQAAVAEIRKIIREKNLSPKEVKNLMRELTAEIFATNNEASKAERMHRKIGRGLVSAWRKATSQSAAQPPNRRATDYEPPKDRTRVLVPKLEERNHRAEVKVDDTGTPDVKLHKDLVEKESGKVYEHVEHPLPPVEPEFVKDQEITVVEKGGKQHKWFITGRLTTEDGVERLGVSPKQGGQTAALIDVNLIRHWQEVAAQNQPEEEKEKVA